MKYTILILLCFFSAKLGFAQEAPANPVSNDTHMPVASYEQMPTPSKINLQSSKKLRGGSRWYDIVEAVDNSQGGIGLVYSNDNYNQLWSDSTMLAPFSGSSGTTYSGVWVKSVAAYFDPVDPRYNDATFYGGEIEVNNASAFSIDSLFIPFVYTRNAAKASIIDTLIVSVVIGNGTGSGNDLDTRYYGPTTNTAINHGTDTLRVLHGFMDLNPASNNQYGYLASTPSRTVTKRIPLTVASENDTTQNGFNYVQIPVNIQVPAGYKAAASIVYKSGDTWVPNVDTMYLSGSFSTPRFNNFRFVAFEESNNGYQQYTKGVWSQAGLMRNDTSGWQNRHIPSYAFSNTSYEHQWFQWKVNCPSCGPVAINDLDNAINEINIYPNPTSDFAIVTFETSKQLDNVKIEVLGLSGNVLSQENVGMVTSNTSFTQQINTASLANGLYFVRLSSSQGQIVKKLMVQ